MSKIAERKALEAYPIAYYRNGGGIDDANASDRAVYEEGYDQAIQDMVKDSEHLQYLSDEMGYAYACGCSKTMQDFMEKAEDAISMIGNHYVGEDYSFDQIWEQFKNYMENGSN